MNFEKQIDELRKKEGYADMAKLASLEDELQEARREAGIPEKRCRLFRSIDRLLENQKERKVSKKTYIRLLLSCGWLTGAHRFYSGKKITGILYLLFFWTGIPFTMCLFDLMAVLPSQIDENGLVTV